MGENEKKIACRKKRSQIKDVLSHLHNHGSITSMEAFSSYHITRLSAIIFRLRRAGYEIDAVEQTGYNVYGNYRYAEYILIWEPENGIFSGEVQA